MSVKNSVLVVEDEEQLLRMLQSTLIQAGCEVVTAKTGMSALEHLIKRDFGVILLDLGLPDMDGKEVIAQSRAISKAPILVISARGSEKEKIAALDIGANDYIAKPFDTGELLARVRVALRPPRRCDSHPQDANRNLVIDFDTRRVIVEGRSVRLSRREAELVRVLVEARGTVVSHEKIIELIWGRSAEADFMAVRVLAWQVRRKIEPDTAAPRYLIAEAGEGYRLKLD
jgi:two-component system KDP operon response regulator KdpE